MLIRDVAYGMLPKAVRARKHFEVGGFIEERAGDRTDEVVALLAEHYGRAAALGDEARLEAAELRADPGQGAAVPRGRGRRGRRALLELRGLRPLPVGTRSGRRRPGDRARIARSRATSRCGSAGSTRRSRCGRSASSTTACEEDLDARRRPPPQDRRRRSGTRASASAAIEHYQKGINLLKDGPPCLELVRLYEEAASLYMQTGDNMLAIYASEKALRLAERLGETRVASRAHGIFGRVFGRIGDTAKARENLERSVELARGSDDGETIRALLALGHHLEISEADYERRRGAPTREGLRLAEQVGDVPAQVELHAALAQLAVLPRRLGRRAALADASAELAEREGLVGKLCLPYALRGLLAVARRATGTTPSACTAAPTSWPSRWAGPRSPSRRCTGSRRRCATAATTPARSTALGPGAGRVRARRADRAVDPGDVARGRSRWPSAARPKPRARRPRRRWSWPTRLHYPVGEAAALEADGATAGDVERVRRAARHALGRARAAARRRALRAEAGRALHGALAEEALERPPPPSTSHSAFRTVRRPRARRLRASGASGNVCCVDKAVQVGVGGVAVAPGDVAADQPGLGGVVGVVGAVEGEVAQGLELRLDAV